MACVQSPVHESRLAAANENLCRVVPAGSVRRETYLQAHLLACSHWNAATMRLFCSLLGLQMPSSPAAQQARNVKPQLSCRSRLLLCICAATAEM